MFYKQPNSINSVFLLILNSITVLINFVRMKNLFYALSLFAAISLANSNLSAQAVQQGNILVDAYVGGPNLLTGAIKLIASSGDVQSNLGTDIKLTASGVIPFGVKGEYMISNVFGLGLDVNHAETKLRMTGTDDLNQPFDIAFNIPRTRAIVTGSAHFGKSDKVDWYGVGGLGIALWSAKVSGTYNTNDVDTQAAIDELKKGVKQTSFGIGYRLGFGTHIYFTDNIGLNLEIGAGGPMLKGGLAVKF